MERLETTLTPEALKAYQEEEAKQRLWRTKVGCFLVVTLMPAGIVLDLSTYPEMTGVFFQFRIGCSLIAALIWGFLFTKQGEANLRILSAAVPLLPAVFIAMMIAVMDGFNSPYYAGLNLVLIAVGTVLVWTYLECLVFVLIVLGMYLIAGLLSPVPPKTGTLISNLVFILMMDFIVVIGTYYQNRLRVQEFALRFELDQRKKELEESYRKLRELDELKSRFFANVSHELRTPLTLLISPLEKLVNQRRRMSDVEIEQNLTVMQANAMRLLKRINDLLDLVRLDSGGMVLHREPVLIAEFLNGIASSVQATARDRGIAIEVHAAQELGTAMLDKDKIEKVLLNLVFNSLKFTAAGGRVVLRAERRDSELMLEVEDTGSGIAPEHLPHVFDRFWQADTSARRKHQGAGLGLAIVKELVEAHGGRIEARSQPGKGTIMTAYLPYEAPPAGSEAGQAAPAAVEPAAVVESPGDAELYRRAERYPTLISLRETIRPEEIHLRGRHPKLLVADDEPDMLRFLRLELSNEFEVIEAVDGQQAVEKARQFLPDVILCDMMMPELDGLEVCRQLRQHTPTRNIPILLLTARADERTKLSALEAGASDFLTKPFSVTELHVRLNNLASVYLFARKLAEQNKALEDALERLKEAQTQLVQAEKLVSLGRLSAGIIHEINNPLNFTKSALHILRRAGSSLPPNEKADFEDIINDIEEGVNRVVHIISELRSFSHPNTAARTEVVLGDIVDSACRFLSHELKSRVELVKNIPPELKINGNPNLLVQVFVNLLQNAADALKHKTFSNGEKPRISMEGGCAGDTVFLIVRDNGEGIAAENLDKIFDPFFTTKDAGQGMGLGLSICYNIVQEHGGRITVKSERGKFCEFRLEFPALVAELKQVHADGSGDKMV